MGRFDIYTETVDIEHNGNEYSYTLKPVKGKAIREFYTAVKGLQNLEDGDMQNLDPQSMESLHKIAVECMREDASDASDDELDRFVSQHLLQLIDPVMKVNMAQIDEDQLEQLRQQEG
jgi:hypothetical protein